MAKRKKNQMLNACDICGAIGYLKELVICCHCKNAFRHSYCMDDLLFDVTMPWHCDDCPQSLDVVNAKKEIMFDNQDFNAEDNDRTKAFLPLGNRDQIMANKLTNKVLVSNAKNDKQSNMEVSGTTHPINKKVANASSYSSSLSKDPGTALPSQKMAPLPNPIHSKEKLANCHDQPCWKGTFEILDGSFLLPPYQGLRAHLSCAVNSEVVNLCKSLSEKLEFKELPLSKTWPKIFMLEPPNTDDVALYFFCDPGRPREKYIRLVERLDSRGHALKAKMKGAQLLLFSSKKLPANSQNTKNGSYLWGIIRFPKSKVILGDTNVKCVSSTSKTMKHTRFDLSNRPTEKRSTDININAKKNVPKSCLVKEPCLNQSENTTKNVAKVISVGKQEKGADGVSVQDIPPGFSKKLPNVPLDTRFNKVKDKVDYYTNNMVDTDLPPGFSNFLPSKQQMNVQLRNDCEKGSIVKNKDVINKVTDISVDPDIPPGFSYPPSAFKSASVNSSLTNSATNLTDQDVPPVAVPPRFSDPSKNDVCTETSSPLYLKSKEVDTSIENVTIKTENSDMSIDSEDENIEKSSMPHVDLSFNNSAIKKDLLVPDISTPTGFPEIHIKHGPLCPTKVTKSIAGAKTNNFISELTSFPLHIKSEEVGMSIENSTMKTGNSGVSIEKEDEKRENSDMLIENEDEKTLNVDMPFNSSIIKKDLLIPNIGPPPGFPEIAVKRHFINPNECSECLQGVKNGICFLESNVKVNKVKIKRETLEYGVVPVSLEPCREDINFVRLDFVQPPLSKDETSTMIKCQKAPIVCAKACDSEKKSGENPRSKSPLSSTKKGNNIISPNSAEECNKFKFTLENGCISYGNNVSWMNKTMMVGVPDDAEKGIFTSNVNAQSEESGKPFGKNMFGVKFSLKKADKPSNPIVPIFFDNSSNTDSQNTPQSFQKAHNSDTDEDGLIWHTNGYRATRVKQATDRTARPNCSTEEKKSTRPLPLTEQCFNTHYISKNPTLTSLPSVKNEGCCASFDEYSTSNAEKASDVSSRTANPESVSEVRRILLEIKKSRELKGKK